MEVHKKPKPMYFASLEVENVKSFGKNQILNLTDSEGILSPWTLILGDNGVGKTTLLKCLTWMLPVELPEDQSSDEKLNIAKQLLDKGVDLSIIKEVTGISIEELKKNEVIRRENSAEYKGNEPNMVKIKPIMDNFDNESDYNSIIRLGEGVEMNIKAKLTNGLSLKAKPSKDDLITIGIRLKREGDEIQDILDTSHLTTANLEEFNSPNLFAYGAARHIAAENIEKPELKDPAYNLLSNSGDLYDAEEVLLDLYNTSVKEKNTLMKKRIEQLEKEVAKTSIEEAQNENFEMEDEGRATKHLKKVKEILTNLLPHIDDPNCIIINQFAEKEGLSNFNIVELKTPFGQVGLRDLSLGYQTMLAWVVDLAIRMFWQNPESEDPLEESAVVIIDEIDLHLHPKWQRTLKEYLTGNFPATQFICTAHSPFMAQASENANLCVLHESKLSRTTSEVYIENNPTIIQGWHIGQVVTNLFGLPELSWDIEEKLINRRRTLLDKEDRTPADEIELSQLNKDILNLPGQENERDKKLLEQINKTVELLRQKKEL